MTSRKLIRFDWAMKYILRNKSNFDVLESFLTNLLNEDIKVLEILESESNKDDEKQKFNRVDLKCKDTKGRIIIIEIQTQREVDYLYRMLWGASKAVTETINSGNKYGDIAKVISINILYHKMREDEKINTDFIYYGTTELVGVHTKEPLVLHEASPVQGELPFVTAKNIFPEYYMIYVEKFQDVINDNIDEWIYFFKYAEVKDDFKSPGIRLLAKKLDYLLMNAKEKRAYDKYLEYLVYEHSAIDLAVYEGREEGLAEGLEKGLAEGLEKGLAEGLEKGLAEGLEKGRAEGIEKGIEKGRVEGIEEGLISVTTNLLRENFSLDKIQLLTGLSIERIKEIKKQESL